jgi:putative transposase
MPWLEANVMELRLQFVLRALRAELPFSALCAEYGISPKTGYKWKERFLRDGAAGLADLSRRPQRCPLQVPEDLLLELIKLKTLHPTWGPKKLRELLLRMQPPLAVPALSTVKRLLQRAGLVKPRRHRRAQDGGRISQAVAASVPNQVWTVDFKGWWYSAERERIQPLTVRDEFSRFVLCAAVLPDGRTQTARACFERLFTNYGLPQVIKSDNGTPFACRNSLLGLSALSVWWVSLGISLDRSRPGCPGDNAAHERMHRDIACEVEGAARGSLRQQQAALEVWRCEFNHQRPHEALGQRFPAEVYQRSPRRYDPRPVALEYPAGYFRRKVGLHGTIKLANRLISLSVALRGWHVGCQLLGHDMFRVWFANLPLGEIDLLRETFSPAPSVITNVAVDPDNVYDHPQVLPMS